MPGPAPPSLTGFIPTPKLTMQPANVIGAVANAQQQQQAIAQEQMMAYQSNLAQQNAMLSGLFGIGTNAIKLLGPSMFGA